MYETFERLMKEKGVTATDVSRATGIPRSNFTDWKMGRSKPKVDKLKKIAHYFGVPLEVLTSSSIQATMPDSISPAKAQTEFQAQISAIVQEKVQSAYYDGFEAGKQAQAVFQNPNLRILMDAVADLDESAIIALAEIAKRMKGTNPDG